MEVLADGSGASGGRGDKDQGKVEVLNVVRAGEDPNPDPHPNPHPNPSPSPNPNPNQVRAGEDCYFGETELLDRQKKAHTVRCAPDTDRGRGWT